jgi:predicted GNAT family acetyltransferase
MAGRGHITVKDNPAECRYEIRVEGELAGFAKYRVEGHRLVFFDTQVDPAHRGEGLGRQLAEAALKSTRDREMLVEARCEFIADYIREHPEHLDLLARSSDQDPRPVV